MLCSKAGSYILHLCNYANTYDLYLWRTMSMTAYYDDVVKFCQNFEPIQNLTNLIKKKLFQPIVIIRVSAREIRSYKKLKIISLMLLLIWKKKKQNFNYRIHLPIKILFEIGLIFITIMKKNVQNNNKKTGQTNSTSK